MASTRKRQGRRLLFPVIADPQTPQVSQYQSQPASLAPQSALDVFESALSPACVAHTS